jgi:hypothetical protein
VRSHRAYGGIGGAHTLYLGNVIDNYLVSMVGVVFLGSSGSFVHELFGKKMSLGGSAPPNPDEDRLSVVDDR